MQFSYDPHSSLPPQKNYLKQIKKKRDYTSGSSEEGKCIHRQRRHDNFKKD
jgi:hypothetical protein